MNNIESLESRRLLSAASVGVTSKGTLIVTGTPLADQVVITRTNLNDPNSALLISITSGDEKTPLSVREKVSAFQRISINLGAGADSLEFDIPGKLKQPTTISGGAGDDTLEAVLPGRATISGGPGNDALFSETTTINVIPGTDREVVLQALDAKNKTGEEVLLGNTGNDTLFGDSNDSVNGSAGKDVAAVLVRNLSASTSNQARANALAAVFYGRIGATDIETFQGQLGATTTNNNGLPTPPSNPGLFGGGGSSTGGPPSVLNPSAPSSPIDFPPSSPGDGVIG